MTAWQTTRTERLVLSKPRADDASRVHELYSDPRVWTHVPRARHTTIGQTQAMLEVWEQEWLSAGLGQWLVRTDPSMPLLGNVGCGVRADGLWWNLSYRLRPEAQGQGFAFEAATMAVSAAHDVAPQRPIVASLVEHNEGSRRLAERLGLRLAFRGPDGRNPDLGGIRLLYTDRAVDPDLLNAIATQ